MTFDLWAWPSENVKNAWLSYKILPCWQMWNSFNFICICILVHIPTCDIVSQRGKKSIRSTCCKATKLVIYCTIWSYSFLFGIKMTVIKFSIKRRTLVQELFAFECLAIFFIILRYIFDHSDLDIWPRVIFNRVNTHTYAYMHTHTHIRTNTHAHIHIHTYAYRLQWIYNPLTIFGGVRNMIIMPLFRHPPPSVPILKNRPL